MCLRALAALRAFTALRTLAALLLAGAGAAAHAQNLLLTADQSTANAQNLVNITATFQGLPATGNVTFTDNGAPLTILPIDHATNLAVLSIASLPVGPHSLSASFAGLTSAPLALTINPRRTYFALTYPGAPVYAGNPVTVTSSYLPGYASGTVTYSEGATPLTAPLSTGSSAPAYQALGDSITYGFGLKDVTQAYPYLFASAAGYNVNDLGDPSAFACDLFPLRINAYTLGPAQAASPLASLLIGTNDADHFGPGPHEANFRTCHQALLSWLAIPRENKLRPNDLGLTFNGAWNYDFSVAAWLGTLYNSSGAGDATFNLTTSGGPLYLYYLIADEVPGSFTLTLDGTPLDLVLNTAPAAPIASELIHYSNSIALLRLPVFSGPHTLQVTVQSGTVGIYGLATPPTPGPTSPHPTVFAGDIPNQAQADPEAALATQLQYTADAQADVALLQADGLDIRPTPTRPFMLGAPQEMVDLLDPNALGHQHLAAALASAYGNTSTAPYMVFNATTPAAPLTFATPGVHTVTAHYSGDAVYAPYTATLDLNVLPANPTATTLTAPATTFYTGQSIPLTANLALAATGIGPTAAALTGTVNLLEGQTVLATAPVAANSAAFSLSGLLPGIHTLYAVYSGDATDTPSTSPMLPLQIGQNPSTVTLTQPTARLPFGTPLTLAAAVLPASASGTVLFSDSYTPPGQVNAQATRTVGQATLTAGAATFTLQTLALGTHTLTAIYSGDPSNTAATSASTTTLVDTIPTATTLAASPAPFGKLSTFTAAVTPADATGTVLFTDSSSPTPVPVALQNGTATWSSSTLIPGTHTLTAAYSGDATHAASASPALAVKVLQIPTTLSLTLPAAPLYPGNPLALTAALTPATATGTVLFSDPTAGVLGQAILTAGTATLTLPALAPGAYTVTATYSGDPDDLPATSTPAALQVLSTATVTTLTAPATSLYGASVSLSASVSPAPPSGLIRFLDHGTLLGSTALANGTAIFSTAALAAGPHTLTATFAGDSTHAASTGSATLTITPGASTTTLTLSQPNLLAGSPAVVNVRVASSTTATPTGTITLRSGATVLAAVLATAPLANGAAGLAYATLSLPTSTPGTYPVTAFYSGDPTTSPSDSSTIALAYTVSPRVASGALTLSATQVPPQTPVTLTAAFTSPATSGPGLVPTGTVTFSSGTTPIATVPLDATGQATATLASTALGTYTLSAVYTPTGVFTAAPVAPTTLTVTPPVAVAFLAAAVAMAPATTTDAALTFTPLSGYQGALITQCTTSQSFITCTVDAPTTLTGPATGKVHLAVASQTATLTRIPIQALTQTTLTLALLLPLCFRSRRRKLPILLLLFLTATLATLTGCGAGNFGQVPPGTYQVQLTATAANTPTQATLTINLN